MKPAADLPFPSPWLLAPMEGVTEPCFRDTVIELHGPDQLGGAFTEFLRVSQQPRTAAEVQAWLGPRRYATPVGVQIMGAAPELVARTAAAAAEAGAPLIDLNFGCPSKGALRGCAGSALLEAPDEIERLVSACRREAGPVPVTAKIRAGLRDDHRLEEVARAAEAGGAQLLTVHCRTAAEAYRDCADWTRLERAVAAVTIPVCGNGGVDRHADGERLLAETGCRFVMVGRAALADPWVFSGESVGLERAVEFLLLYAERLEREAGLSPRGVAGRLKQLLGTWTAGGLACEDRTSWLRETDPRGRLARLAAGRSYTARLAQGT